MRFWSRKGVELTLKYLWISSLAIFAMYGFSAYPSLPERVATSYNLKGVPNGWSPKLGFFILYYSIIYGINFVVIFIVPRSLSKKPASAINIRNKNYWLATDQRKAEYIKLTKTMTFGIALMLNFMAGVLLYGMVQSNTGAAEPFTIWTFLVPVGPLIIFIAVYSLTAFRKPREQ